MTPPEIILATTNRHKVCEIQEIFSDLSITFLSPEQFPKMPKIIEDGKTFEENAIKKASLVSQYTGKIALADDSGIAVDFLNGAPGIYSARFAGEEASDEENNSKLMTLLSQVPDEKRRAVYHCVVAVATPEGKCFTSEGICEGKIAIKPSGKQGFGYDPIFYYPPFQKTFGNTPPLDKNRVSHRFQALILMRPKIISLLLNTHNH